MNPHFSLVESQRLEKQRDGTKKVIPRTLIQYKCVTIAIVEGDDQVKQAIAWLKVYGYLAEWISQKYLVGKYVNWTDDMHVDVQLETV
jgi:hypothetical protein